MTQDYDYGVQISYTLHLFLCCWYNHKTGVALTGTFDLTFKIKFGHAQISVPKIGTLIMKTACINPW